MAGMSRSTVRTVRFSPIGSAVMRESNCQAPLVGEVTTADATALLGLSQRQVWRSSDGTSKVTHRPLVHGNRGRPSPLPARHVYPGADPRTWGRRSTRRERNDGPR